MPTSSPSRLASARPAAKSVLVLDRDDLVIYPGVQRIGDESPRRCPVSCASRRALREHRRARRLDRDDLDVRIPALEVLAHAGERAARTDARNKRYRPYQVVSSQISGPRRLEAQRTALLVNWLGMKLFGVSAAPAPSLSRPSCPLPRRSRNYLRAVGLGNTPLYAHRLRHGEYNFIAP